ncbi:hypothetical protein BDN72DRAFT_836430 [Pluteus cervinus]|uniref:Uncharacterized protein n=1 Tax=Pluteus cervinus TaxID=181527 RepID=A0ACD3B1V3_9AGAR|nr:hypothetical protein BDN72DRAFT_836430 [Pluteus cervinus]
MSVPSGNSILDNTVQERLRIDMEITEIDARIFELRLARAALRKRRNSLAQVSRLSQDVFRSIFEEVRAGIEPDIDQQEIFPFSNPRKLKSQFPWIRALTHVCSQWRELALSTPTLWTRIFLGNSKLATEMLIRSQAAPISIIVPAGADVQPASRLLVQEALQDHLHRAKHLDLCLPYRRYEEFVTPILQSKPAPNLLEVCSLGVSFLLSSEPDMDLPVDLLVDSARSLRHLSLDLCVFPLKRLNTHVSFSSLSSLQVKNGTTRCAELLDFVSLPIPCSLHIITWGPANSLSDYSSLWPSVRRFWEDSPDKEPRSLAIGPLDANVYAPTYTHELRMTFWDRDPINGTLAIQLSHLPFSFPEVSNMFISFLSLVPLHHMTHLTVNCVFQDTFWAYVGNSCRQITHLRIGVSNLDTILGTVHIRGQLRFAGTGDGITLNSLEREEALSAIPVRLPELVSVTFTVMRMPVEHLDRLEECLVVRRLLGKELHSLAFENVIGIEAEQANDLSRYVKDEILWSYDVDSSSDGDH